MKILVDSSIWIDYFRSGIKSSKLDMYIEQNLICINELILAELIPFLKVKKQYRVIKLLNTITSIPLSINWQKVIDFQTTCLLHGLNNVSIPDLVNLDHVIQNDLVLLTLDKHFSLINDYINFELLDA